VLFDGADKKRILVIAPHPDDETLGAGGTIAKCSSLGHQVSVLIVSGHLPPLYSRDAYETTVREAKKAFEILGVADHSFLEIPATFVGNEPIHVLNERIAAVIRRVKPQIVLCSYPDRHIDHRLIFDSVMVATRPVGEGAGIELVAAYETLSETHWNAPHIEPNFVPNWVVDISEQIHKKLQALECYGSQVTDFPGSRSIEAVEALGKFRGTQAGFAFGEAFHVIRMRS
jgi:LmbE family N-acetylglucosaminyl deacetylase